MATTSIPMPDVSTEASAQASWMPMLVVAMAQIMMIFNVSTLQVSIEAIASSFALSATAIGTVIVTFSLALAAFILLGARVAQAYGARRVFRAAVLLFGAAMAVMSLSLGNTMMLSSQVVAGIAAAAIVPSLVVLIAQNYQGQQKAAAFGWLGGAQAMGVVLALLIAGLVAAWPGWRFTFVLLAVLAVAIYRMSDKLSQAKPSGHVSVDWTGVALAASSIVLISIGANSLTAWGMLLAGPGAPFSVLDMSPAPLMVVMGLFLGQAFVSWSRRRQGRGETPLVALKVMETSEERAALLSIFVISALGSAIMFLIPLYIQIVQGRSSIDTALALIPFSLASFAAAVLVVRVLGGFPPRTTARYAFLLVAVGIAWLGAVVRNDWSDAAVVIGMIVIGLGEGTLFTLLFNVLVTASPKELAGDVGSLRGVVNNLATGFGTAVAAALVVALLSTSVHRELVHNELITTELKTEVNLDSPAFTSNDRLREVSRQTSATPEQVDEAVRINTGVRLVALKVTLFALAMLALLMFFPAGTLPAPVASSTPSGDDHHSPGAGAG
jgi:MFS family permease